MLKKRVSFIVPAYNESRNLRGVVERIHSVAPKFCSDYEIIIVNDGSTDKTLKAAQTISKKDKRVIVLDNSSNRGMGYSYFRGIDNSRFEYAMIIFGDNDHPAESITKILSRIGKADIIIAYYKNLHLTKTWLRHVISITYTHIVNGITGLEIAYYNGMTLHRTDLLRQVPRFTESFGFQAETIIYLVKRGASFIEVDIFNEDRKSGISAAFKLKNILGVSLSFLRLYRYYQIQSNHQHPRPLKLH